MNALPHGCLDTCDEGGVECGADGADCDGIGVWRSPGITAGGKTGGCSDCVVTCPINCGVGGKTGDCEIGGCACC